MRKKRRFHVGARFEIMRHKKELIVGGLLAVAIAGTVVYGEAQSEYDILSRVADTTTPSTQESQTEGSLGTEDREQMPIESYEMTETDSLGTEVSDVLSEEEGTLEGQIEKETLKERELATAERQSEKALDTAGEALEEASVKGSSKIEDAEQSKVEEGTKEAETKETDIPEHPEERPEYDPLKYAKACDLSEVSVDPPKPNTVTEEEVENAIRKIFRNKELWVRIDGPAKKNDMVEIDYIGKANGKEVVKKDGETAVLGEGTLPAEFEATVLGLCAEDSADFSITYPKEYSDEEFAGKEVEYTVTVKAVNRIPEVRDEFVKKASDGIYQTTKEYKAYIREILEKDKQTEAEEAYVNEFLQVALEKCEVTDFPEDVLQYDLEESYIYYQGMAELTGQDFSDYLKDHLGVTEKEFADAEAESVKGNLEYQIKLLALAKENGMWVDDDKLNDRAVEAALEHGFVTTEGLLRAEYNLREILARMDISAYALQKAEKPKTVGDLEPPTLTKFEKGSTTRQ